MNRLTTIFAALFAFWLGSIEVSAIGTSFSYQGELIENGAPANGTYTMKFRLWTAASGGSQVGSTLTLFDKPIVNGRFTTSLGFGSNAYASLNRWLEIEVEGTVLEPRQRLESVPHSIETRGMHVSPDESFIGIGRTDQVTQFEKFGVYADTTNFGGMYMETSEGGEPFYGYATSGSIDAYHYYDSANDQWRLWCFGDRLVVNRSNGYVGIGTVAPTSRIHVQTSSSRAVYVANDGAVGLGDGVVSEVFGDQSAAFYGISNDIDGYAGLFDGQVAVIGTLSKTAGSFTIDHPLDPEGMTLSHSFVESPDMMNIYNGNVVTDAAGYATVELPEYFEALNRDYRYQLTVIGTFARAIVAEEVRDGTFVIQTDEPGVKVSWQVTGIRDDAYARMHPIVVEQEKSESERGLYLTPEAFGYGHERSITHAERGEGPVESDQGAVQ